MPRYFRCSPWRFCRAHVLARRSRHRQRTRAKASTQPAPDHFIEGFRIERTDASRRIENTMIGRRAATFQRRKALLLISRYSANRPVNRRWTFARSVQVLRSGGTAGGLEQVDFSGRWWRGGQQPGRDAVTRSETPPVFPENAAGPYRNNHAHSQR